MNKESTVVGIDQYINDLIDDKEDINGEFADLLLQMDGKFIAIDSGDVDTIDKLAHLFFQQVKIQDQLIELVKHFQCQNNRQGVIKHDTKI